MLVQQLLLGAAAWVALAALLLKLVLEKLTQRNYDFIWAWVRRPSCVSSACLRL